MTSPARKSEAVVSDPPVSDAPPRASRRRRWPWVAGVAVLALVAFLVLRSGKKGATQAAAAQAQASRAVPVVAVPAKSGDMGVFLTGLGTVTAINTVTVRSRVDGQLIRVGFREGQLVHQGDLLAEIDPRPFQVQLIQAEGQRGKDEATLANARVDLKRYQVLVQQDAIPKQQLDTQVATVNQLEATLKSDQGGIESAKLNLAYSRITAPITGTVGLKLVDPGNIVHANDPNGIVVITQLQPITIVFTIPADQLPAVQRQMKTGSKLPVEAWDRDLKKQLATGTLLAVDNQIDPTTGTVRIKALFANEDAALFANQFVNARLLVDTLRNTVIIPTAALQRSPQTTFVWALKADSTVEMRNVDVQLTEGDATSIRKGIAPGEAVVTEGVDKLQPGTKVVSGGGGGEAGAGGAARGASSGGKSGKPRNSGQ